MKPRSLRRVALLLLGALLFAQASVALASSCPMDRGMLTVVIGAAPNEGCGDCGATVSALGALYANRCVTHCTADLQLGGLPVALVRAPAQSPVLLVEAPALKPDRAALYAPPRRDPPRRVLLHSYLI